MSIQGTLTEFGFDWGPVKVRRYFSDMKKGWVTLGIETKKHPGMQVYVTKTGKVRIFSNGLEWLPEKKETINAG